MQSQVGSSVIPAVKVNALSFAYGSGGGKKVLDDVSFELPRGSRALIVGLNGTGKSTLLRVLSGLHFHTPDAVLICGRPAFQDTPKTLTFLGAEWRHNSLVKSDVGVQRLLDGSEGASNRERMQVLVDMLSLQTNGRMHELSDGQRQSVQIAMGLLKPFEVLLLDEVTVDVDVLARRNLMNFLRQESEGPLKSTILYATHVFDSLSEWPTHIIHVANHRIRVCEELDKCQEYLQMCETWNPRKGSPLSELVELWLQREFDERKSLKEQVVEPTVEEKLKNDRNVGDRFYNYWK